MDTVGLEHADLRLKPGGGTYVGPDGFAEMHGMPHVVTPRRLARDPQSARRLWEISEEATGVRYP